MFSTDLFLLCLDLFFLLTEADGRLAKVFSDFSAVLLKHQLTGRHQLLVRERIHEITNLTVKVVFDRDNSRLVSVNITIYVN